MNECYSMNVGLISKNVSNFILTNFCLSDLKPIIRTILVKVHMHCDKCEADLKRRLIKHRGKSITIYIIEIIFFLFFLQTYVIYLYNIKSYFMI